MYVAHSLTDWIFAACWKSTKSNSKTCSIRLMGTSNCPSWKTLSTKANALPNSQTRSWNKYIWHSVHGKRPYSSQPSQTVFLSFTKYVWSWIYENYPNTIKPKQTTVPLWTSQIDGPWQHVAQNWIRLLLPWSGLVSEQFWFTWVGISTQTLKLVIQYTHFTYGIQLIN